MIHSPSRISRVDCRFAPPLNSSRNPFGHFFTLLCTLLHCLLRIKQSRHTRYTRGRGSRELAPLDASRCFSMLLEGSSGNSHLEQASRREIAIPVVRYSSLPVHSEVCHRRTNGSRIKHGGESIGFQNDPRDRDQREIDRTMIRVHDHGDRCARCERECSSNDDARKKTLTLFRRNA